MEKNAADRSGARTSQRERRAVPKEKRNSCEKIRAESDKSSAEQSGEISVVQKNAEQREYPIREGRQTTAEKYTGRWNIMQ